jgi:pyridoxamine 5'-phosphate oxidase
MMNANLSEMTIPKDPFSLFKIWYVEHLSSKPRIEGVVYLATAAEGRVSLRTVLLKDFDESGFVFFTNYNSRKALQLLSAGNAALLFYWPEKDRQVRIEGSAEKIDPALSDEYFKSRPRESRIAAWASNQSTEIPDRDFLEKEFERYNKLYSGNDVPRPSHWGGFRIVPDWFEFWQDREHRMHDRIVYSAIKDGWKIKRLAP